MLVVRHGEATDESSIREFLSEFYGERFAAKYPDRWRWQFEENPFSPAHCLPIIIAVDGQRVVGQLGMQYAPVWMNGELREAAWGVDFCVLPAYRGRGLGSRLQKEAVRSVPLLLSASMDRAAVRIKKRLGFISGQPIRSWRRFCQTSGDDIMRFARSKSVSRGRLYGRSVEVLGERLRLARLAAAMVRCDGRRRVHNNSRPFLDGTHRIEEVDAFDADVDRLWAAARNDYRMITLRSREFLNWRYVKCPRLKYRKMVAVANGGTKGYVVVRERLLPEIPSVRVLDLFALRSDRHTMSQLLGHVVDCYQNRVPYLEMACSDPGIEKMLSGHGFVALESHVPLMGGEASSSPEDREAVQDWCVTQGDHDWDQFSPLPALD